MKLGTPLYHLSIDRYPALKSQWPTDGRRKLLLRVGEEFWRDGISSESQSLIAEVANTKPNPELLQDEDRYDQFTDGPELGILLRTDYSDEDAWQAFYTLLREGEQELAGEEQTDALGNASNSVSQCQADEDVEMAGTEDEEDEEDEDEDPPHIFKVINPNSPQDRAVFANISNLGALRLLNNMDIRRAPSPPPGTKRLSPNRLIDQRGWQEVYTGKSVWIYDVRSNSDQCVRVVSQEGASLYGTATADSWRARVTHICEIQMNIHAGMKIDFGERDGWDYSERRRNLDEAAAPIL